MTTRVVIQMHGVVDQSFDRRRQDHKRQKSRRKWLHCQTLLASGMTVMTMMMLTGVVVPVKALVPPLSSWQSKNQLYSVSLLKSTTLLLSSSSSSSSMTSTKTTNELVLVESQALARAVLQKMEDESIILGISHSDMFGLDEMVGRCNGQRNAPSSSSSSSSSSATTRTCAGLYGLVHAISKTVTLGLKGHPFVLRKKDLERVMLSSLSSSSSSTLSSSSILMFEDFFTMDDLEQALEDDFLDAARGSTDKNKAWQITTVSEPLGDSFEEARMDIEDVNKALELGTVIFNAAGAHIPKLAGPCLAVTDATSTPNAVNLYLTKSNKPTSAPPHTDRQDVVVVQSTGTKHWKVFAPPPPSLKPQADPFSRGKNTDALPLHRLEATAPLLLETDLQKGDVLFVPGGFPHTTSTTIASSASHNGDEETTVEENSLHLTFNIDHLIWDLSYLSARRLALRRAHVRDPLTAGDNTIDDHDSIAVYVGNVNKLPIDVHQQIMAELPLGLLDDVADCDDRGVTVEDVTAQLKHISNLVDEESFSQVPDEVWVETVQRLQQHGRNLLEIHRDMYLAALDEGRARKAEEAMTAHLDVDDSADDDTAGSKRKRRRKAMTPERMQRLSLFRVKRYFEEVDRVKNELIAWSYEGMQSSTAGVGATSASGDGTSSQALPANWAFTMPVSVGDQVEADLGGAFFPATVISVDTNGESFTVQFFDGDRETLDRSGIKLQKPPKIASSSDCDDIDTTGMTAKQIKRLKKQQNKQK